MVRINYKKSHEYYHTFSRTQDSVENRCTLQSRKTLSSTNKSLFSASPLCVQYKNIPTLIACCVKHCFCTKQLSPPIIHNIRHYGLSLHI